MGSAIGFVAGAVLAMGRRSCAPLALEKRDQLPLTMEQAKVLAPSGGTTIGTQARQVINEILTWLRASRLFSPGAV